MGDYKIVKLKGLKFAGILNVVCEMQGGYGLYEVNHGFVSFKGNNEGKLVKTPYTNKKKVLQKIIDDDGLVNFSEVDWVHPIN